MSELGRTVDTPEAPDDRDVPAPRRLHPITPFFTLLAGGGFNITGVVAIVAATWRSGPGMTAVVIGAGAALLLLFRWLDWLRFTYHVTEDEIVVDSGLLSRHRRAVPLERVQDIAIERGPLMRLLGLARVRIEGGGGGSDEITLDTVALVEAERLRAVVRGGGVSHAAPAAEGAGAGESPAPDDEQLLYRLNLGGLLLSGLLSFSLFWVAAAMGALQFVDDLIGIDVGAAFDWLELRRETLTGREMLYLALGVIGLGLASGLLQTVLRDFGFRLTLSQGRLRRVSGLLNRGESILSIARVQVGLAERVWLRGWLGFSSLSVQTLGGGNDSGGRHRIAPFARDATVERLLDIVRLPGFARIDLRRVSIAHIPRTLIKHALFPTILLVAAVIYAPAAWPLLGLIPLLVGVALLQRRHHRYLLLPEGLQVERGVLTARRWIIPYDRIQQVAVTRSPMQRVFGIATVVVSTAGEVARFRPDILDLPREDADAIAAELIARV